MSAVKSTPEQASIETRSVKLDWTREESEWRLRVLGRAENGQWTCLAGETARTGFRAFLFGPVSWRERVYRIPSCVQPAASGDDTLRWEWTQEVGATELQMECSYTVHEAGCLLGKISWRLPCANQRPHFGYGVAVERDEAIDNFSWLYSPSQMGYFDRDTGLTLWLISTYDHSAGISKYDGCQALEINMSDVGVLECNVKLPPGYTDFDSKNLLAAGETVSVHFAFLVAEGTYYDTMAQVLKIQPLEALAPRYSLRQHVDLVMRALQDPRKWHAEGDGIINHGVVRRDPSTGHFVIDEDREGPGWSGCWDLEMIYAFNQYRHLYADEATKRFIDEHSIRMLKGWIENPRFRLGATVSWRAPGDMKDSFVAAVRVQGPVRQEQEQDIIWTCHNAYMIYFLSKLTTLTGDPGYRQHALQIAEWFLRMQAADGSVPSLWAFENGKARVIREFQPGSCLYMTSGLLELHKATQDERYRQSALRLADFAYPQLTAKIPHWGQGELDWLYLDAHAIDPTGVAYIIWGYADAFQATGDERYRQMVDKFTAIMISLFALWEPHEEQLRGSYKVTLGAHGMDRKIAGGITHGNWPARYGHALMNRNELGDALLRAYEVTGNETYRDFLVAFVNWHTYFQFTGDVKEEPVSTVGSCPQNHRWTSSQPNYNNDWGCTASKMASLIMKLIQKGILEDQEGA